MKTSIVISKNLLSKALLLGLFLIIGMASSFANTPNTSDQIAGPGGNPLDEDTKVKMRVGPNPIKDYFILTAENEDHTLVTMVFSNPLGQRLIVKKMLADGTDNRIDVANLNSGIYFLSILDGKKIQTQRMMITG